MSGIRTGTRLEQLERLQARTSYELAAARRREDWRDVPRLEELRDRLAEEISTLRPREIPAPATAAQPRPRSVAVGPSAEVQLLAELGVSARDVKVWAVGQGLLEVVTRGRVKLELVQRYAEAHRGS